MNQLFTLAVTMEIGRDHWNLRHEPERLAPLRMLRIVITGRVKATER
jgi:hypothetical protein